MSPHSSWPLPPKGLRLAGGEVHVWRGCLDLTTSRVESLRHILDAGELTRAERFCFEKDRRHFIVTHGLLRVILGRYVDLEPGKLRFRHNGSGKPALVKDSGADGIRFNLSHSHGLVLFAVTRDREIGIDLEHIRPIAAFMEIAEGFFSRREAATLRSLPSHLQQEAFFTCWVRKEAYIKAIGKGLAFPLNRFDVTLAPGEPAALLSVKGDAEAASRWSLQALAAGPGYVAALAVEGREACLKLWKWAEQA